MTHVHRLTSIAFSHYCEKARWALERYGVSYRERRVLPFVHVVAVHAVHRGTKGTTDRASSPYSTPVLQTPDGQVLCDSAAILRYISTQFAPAGQELYSDDAPDSLEQRLHDRLGPHTRRLAYGVMLEDPALLREVARRNVDWLQSRSFSLAMPLLLGQMRRIFDIHPESLARSRDVTRHEMDAVSAQLADGRPYLGGDRFGAADLALACMAAPVTLPPEYGAWLPEPANLPAEYQQLVAEMRETPAGRHALRMFAEERRLRVGERAEESGLRPAASP